MGQRNIKKAENRRSVDDLFSPHRSEQIPTEEKPRRVSFPSHPFKDISLPAAKHVGSLIISLTLSTGKSMRTINLQVMQGCKIGRDITLLELRSETSSDGNHRKKLLDDHVKLVFGKRVFGGF